MVPPTLCAAQLPHVSGYIGFASFLPQSAGFPKAKDRFVLEKVAFVSRCPCVSHRVTLLECHVHAGKLMGCSLGGDWIEWHETKRGSGETIGKDN